jgi:phosphonate transport system substrate-binding protein
MFDIQKIRIALFMGLSGLFVLGMVSLATTAQAAECPRGTLDKQYCDRDGNLTADLPIDQSKWVDPDALIFAYTPVEDPAVYKSVWAGFIDHLSKTTGKKVVFFSVQSNAAQLEAMRSGRLHVAGFNTGSNPIAVSCAGFVPFAMMASDDGSFGYEMEIIFLWTVPLSRLLTSREKHSRLLRPHQTLETRLHLPC